MLRLDIAAHLEPLWAEHIDRHFRMTLTPFGDALKDLTVKFTCNEATDLNPPAYVCQLNAARATGRRLSVCVVRDDPRAAIADAFAGARREMRRSARLAHR